MGKRVNCFSLAVIFKMVSVRHSRKYDGKYLVLKGLCLYLMQSFYETKPLTQTFGKTDHETCFSKCSGKWLHVINQ